MIVPRAVAISPPAPGPWLDRLPGLAADALLVRLVDAPGALAEVLDAVPPGLPVLVRPVRPADVDTAIERGLGLHLPSRTDPGRLRARQPGLLSAACHDLGELRRAAAAGADMALLSPVFSPGSKPGDARPTLGVQGFLALSGAVSIPVLALGGITAARAAALRAAGAHGTAGISCYFSEKTC